MASSLQQQELLQVTQALFNAVPGATYLSQFSQMVDQGMSVASVANALAHSSVFNAVMMGYSYNDTLSSATFANSFVNDLLGSHVAAENKTLVSDYIVQQMATGKSQADMISWATDALGQISSADPSWGAAAASYNTAVTTKVVDNLLGSSVSAENRADVVNHIIANIEQGQSLGSMIEWAVTALDSVPADNAAFGSAAAQFDTKMDISNQISVVQGVSFASLEAIQLTQSLLNQVGTTEISTALINQVATLVELAESKPEVVRALLPDNGDLATLLSSMPAGATFADVVALTTEIAETATDLAAVTTLLGDGAGDLSGFLTTLPTGTTLTNLLDVAASGDLADLGDLADVTVTPPPVVTPPPAGGGGGAAPTFTVTEDGSHVVNFGGTATGDITVAWSGAVGSTVATFTRGGLTGTADFATATSITLGASDTLSATAADLTGVTIDGAGTVAITALNATAAADLHLITATTVTAAVAADVTFTGNLGTAVVTVADGATLATTAAIATGHTVNKAATGIEAIDATALNWGTPLTVAGSVDTRVTALGGTVDASAVTGTLTVTTVDSAMHVATVTTGSGNLSLTTAVGNYFVSVDAAAMTAAQTITLGAGASAIMVANLTSTGAYDGSLHTGPQDVTGGAHAQTITTGAGNDGITMQVTAGNIDTIDAGAGLDYLTLSGAAVAAGAITVDLSLADQFSDGVDALTQTGFENVNATGVTGARVDVKTIAATTEVDLGSMPGATISGAATALIVDAGTLADDAAVTLSGAAMVPTVTGLVGTLVASAVTGTLTVTTADAIDNTVTIIAGSGNLDLTAAAAGDTVNVNAAAMAAAQTITLAAGASDIYVSNLTSTGLYDGHLHTGQQMVLGSGGTNTEAITTGTGNDYIFGGAGNDIINGGAGNDIIIGDAGNDTITGGAGNDETSMNVTAGDIDAIDAGADVDQLLLFGAAAGVITVDLSQADQFADTVDALTQTGFENVNATGVTGAQVDVVTIAATTTVGLGSVTGATISGAATALNVNASALADGATVTLSGANMVPTVTGLVGGLVATAVTGTLTVTTADAIDNTVTVIAGSGNLILTAAAAGDTVNVSAIAMNAAQTITLGAGASNIDVVNLTSTGVYDGNLNTGAQIVTGGMNAQTIITGAGDDIIIGGAGGDTLTGGAGIDDFGFFAGNSTLAAMDTLTDYRAPMGANASALDTIGFDVAVALATITTVQDLSDPNVYATLAVALDFAANANSVNNGVSVFLGWDGTSTATYVYVEAIGGGNTYTAGDTVIQITGVLPAPTSAIAGFGIGGL